MQPDELQRLVICEKCGAVIDTYGDRQKAHDEFHKKLEAKGVK